MKKNAEVNYLGRDEVVSFFGYWPEFCDAKIRAFIFDRTKEHACSIKVRIYYIDSNQNKSAELEIEFGDVSELNINNIFTDNVLDNLIINSNKSLLNNQYEVLFIACAGLSGKFMCENIQVKIKSMESIEKED